MGGVRPGCATTAQALRAAVQRGRASSAALSRTLGIEVGTVARWRRRGTVGDRRSGPKEPRPGRSSRGRGSHRLAFRGRTRLPLEDGLQALRPTIPYRTGSSLHRCLQRHGTGRLPEASGDGPTGRRLRRCRSGCFPKGPELTAPRAGSTSSPPPAAPAGSPSPAWPERPGRRQRRSRPARSGRRHPLPAPRRADRSSRRGAIGPSATARGIQVTGGQGGAVAMERILDRARRERGASAGRPR